LSLLLGEFKQFGVDVGESYVVPNGVLDLIHKTVELLHSLLGVMNLGVALREESFASDHVAL